MRRFRQEFEIYEEMRMNFAAVWWLFCSNNKVFNKYRRRVKLSLNVVWCYYYFFLIIMRFC